MQIMIQQVWGCGLRFCIPNKLPGNANASGLRTTLSIRIVAECALNLHFKLYFLLVPTMCSRPVLILQTHVAIQFNQNKLFSSLVALTTFQMFKSHMWLVATMLDSTCSKNLAIITEKFYWTVLLQTEGSISSSSGLLVPCLSSFWSFTEYTHIILPPKVKCIFQELLIFQAYLFYEPFLKWKLSVLSTSFKFARLFFLSNVFRTVFCLPRIHSIPVSNSLSSGCRIPFSMRWGGG